MAEKKQGLTEKITTKEEKAEAEFKTGEIIKKDCSSVLTISGGKPVRKYFQDGKLVLTEEVKK